MARWRLRGPHYLHIVDPDSGDRTKWQYEEQSRETGKMARKQFIVPYLLDPRDSRSGEMYVCWEDKGDRGDITFFGDPTPDMEPMDDEAEAVTASMEEEWAHPIDSLPANGGMNEKESAFMEAMMKAFGGAANAAVPAGSEIAELRKQLDEMRAIVANIAPQSPIAEDHPVKTRRA